MKNAIYTNNFNNKDFKINLLPNRLHYISLARNLPKPVWNKFRKMHIATKNGTCELCGLKMQSYHNCHEIFEVSDGVVKLIDIKVLCNSCHMTQHIGFVSLGKADLTMDELKKHYEKISKKDFNKERNQAIAEYERAYELLKDMYLKFDIDQNLIGKEVIEDYKNFIEELINKKL